MEKIFGRGGCLKDILPFYEYRQEQLEIAQVVKKTLIQGDTVFIEAGTGIGKTLAYLIPAAEEAIFNSCVIAVSTETKALQKQLIDKDLPVVSAIMREVHGVDLDYSLCLGSSNYVCVRRYQEIINRGGYLYENTAEISEIGRLIESGEEFTRLDRKISSSLWHDIERDSDGCDGNTCGYFKMCPFQNARKKWNGSQLLVMNHYLFYSNCAMGKAYLPPINHVIFDEAHSIESIASRQLGFDLSLGLVNDIAFEFYGIQRKKLRSGKSGALSEKLIEKVQVMEREGKILFEGITHYTKGKRHHRLRSSLPEVTNLHNAAADLLEECGIAFKDESDDADVSAVLSKLKRMNDSIEKCEAYDKSKNVIWLEDEERDSLPSIYGIPVEIGSIMRSDVFDVYESVSFVSATLSVSKNFRFIAERLGAEEYRSFSYESPFDYKSNVVLYIPKEIPAPNEPGYIEAAAYQIAECTRIMNGNTLALFTSYETMKECAIILREISDIPLFVQGERETSTILEEYRENPGGILMGTHSFWQGIDLPGDLVKCVIITKLPFPVPNRPEIEARGEIVSERGENSFFDYQLPLAVIQFKQGFGRLVRRHGDKGVVAVLDSRIIGKRYGKTFIESIPACLYADRIEDVERKVIKHF